MFAGYIVGACVTAAMITRANRVTGQNYVYLAAATVLWPGWLAMYGLTDSH